MQRWCTKLRSLAVSLSTPKTTILSLSSPSHRLLHSSPQLLHNSLASTVISSNFKPLFNASSALHPSLLNHTVFSSPLPRLSLIQVRHRTKSKEKKKMMKFKPRTPVTSKIKKIKMKFYSSYKDRFKVLNDGTIRRWKEGRRHNAHLKSKKAKRRLRQPGLVPLAYAKVMKKLNFCS
ncbi:50S ribosomal protein [Actinidia chinensis var. chinensis]|uniref:50S ribosomal protein n=1 Tax=Actinidia chinensis var. chinensis TaxID=1590841 RepID=A0A2R6PD01_ACTCC|nr:50S ribosomal protein [Actinidia chinensis var. chinensis]